jgi:thioredoxin-like negative regulator of GroEL
MKELEKLEDIQQNQVVLIFTSDWCSDCIKLKMFIDEIIDNHKDWQFYSVDRDKFIELAKFYNIYGIPSFVALREGELILDLISKEEKSYQQVEKFMNQLERA